MYESGLDVCLFKYLVAQAGGMRGGKTFLGFSAVRDSARGSVGGFSQSFSDAQTACLCEE
jgi:hypothetical protein